MSIANTQAKTIIEAGILDDNDQTRARVEHLKELETLVGNSYPNIYKRSFIVYDFETKRDENKDKHLPKLEDTISRIRECREIEEIAKELKDATPTGEKPDQELKAALNEKLKAFGDVRISGRLAVPPRVMGKAAFVHLSDGVNRLQIYVRKQDAKVVSNDTGEIIEGDDAAWDFFKLLDHGDFVGASGFLFLTNTGELSVHVETLQFLSKALVPMPDKMHGIADPELQRRYRYADLIASSLQIEHEGLTTREVFERRAKLISGMRRFLDDAGYIEVETPMLTPKATGAAAKPFQTHHNALDITLYARIAPELYLKRLTVGGFERVYELNRNFRNEGLSQKHNPEFTMLEFYCAYMDVNGMMDFAEAMIKESVQKAIGGTKVKVQEILTAHPFPLLKYFGSRSTEMTSHDVIGQESLIIFESEIDFSEFQRLTMKEAIARECSFEKDLINEDFTTWLDRGANAKVLSNFLLWVNDDLYREKIFLDDTGEPVKELLQEETNKLIREKWEEINRKYTDINLTEIEKDREIISLFEYYVEENLIQPTFIIDYPKSISPLSKASPENPQIAERFELFINGMECANGFSELNDPQEQYERFVDQMRERETGDEEAMVLDEDYIRALAYGMPPAAGIGIGIDRLVMLLTNKHSIRDVILFPHMRPEKREAEKEESDSKDDLQT